MTVFDGRDLQIYAAGIVTALVVRWIRNPDRPRSPAAEHVARKNLEARLGLWLSGYVRLRERVTGRRAAPGWELEVTRRIAWRWPRMWL